MASAGTDARVRRAEAGRRPRRAERRAARRAPRRRARGRAHRAPAAGGGAADGRAPRSVPTNTMPTRLPARPGELVHGQRASGCEAAPVHCTAVRVDQVIPSLASRDAIGVHTLHLPTGCAPPASTRTSSTATAPPTCRPRAGRSSSWAGPTRTAGCSTRPPSGARCSTSWPPGPSPSWSTTTTSPRPPCLSDWEPNVGLRGGAGPDPAGAAGAPEPLRRGRLGLQRVRAASRSATRARRSSPC